MSGAVVAADPPGGAIGEMFLFPDGDPRLYFVDDVSAGVEGGVPVGGGNADDDGETTDSDLSDAVDAGRVEDFEAFPGLRENALTFLFRERCVGFVFEVIHAATFVMVADPAFERAEAAGRGIENGVAEGLGVEGGGLNVKGHEDGANPRRRVE